MADPHLTGAALGQWGRQLVVDDGDPAFIIDQLGTGSILELRDGGTKVLEVIDGGHGRFADLKELRFGAGDDLKIYSDGANGIIDAVTQAQHKIGGADKVVLTASLLDVKDGVILELNEPLKWDAGGAITAGNYEIGRNADATNLLQYNVPTGSKHEFSINDVAKAVLETNQFEVYSGVTLTIGAALKLDGDTAVIAGAYNIQRRTTGGNIIAYNVPTGAAHRFSINDVQKLLLDATGLTVADALEVNGDLNHDGSNVGLYGVTPVAQASKINDPSGGATVDAESRTAINSIIDALEGIGISASA